MNEEKATKIFINTVKDLWSDWWPTEAEEKIWISKLQDFDYEIAMKVITDYYANKGGRKPKLDKILEGLRAASTQTKNQCICICHYRLIREEDYRAGKEGKGYYGSGKKTLPKAPHQIEKAAEQTRQAYKSLYSGNWIVLRDWEKYYENGQLRPDWQEIARKEPLNYC